MPRAKKTAEPGSPPGPAQQDDGNRSEEVQVVLPAADEPVRRGGHILTEDGWVVEDQPAPIEDEAAEPEQEN